MSEAAIEGALQAGSVIEKPKGIAKGRKRQISHTLSPEMLSRVDELAKRWGLTRAGVINLFIALGFENGRSR